MKRPGLGSVFVRLLAILNAGFWFLSIPEFLDVWGRPDGYTVPSEIPLPRATIWIVAAMMVATVGLVCIGWWQRRTRAVAPWVRASAWVVAGMQLAWAVLLMWSNVLSQAAYNATGDFNSSGAGLYFEGFLAIIGVLSALPLVRDALATAPPPPSPPSRPRSARVGLGSAVLRGILIVVFAGLFAALPGYLAGWNHQEAQYASGSANVPWGPFFCAIVFGLTVAMLPLGWWWRRHSAAPARAWIWLRTAAALEALWAFLVVIKIFLDPIGLTRQVVLGVTDEMMMVPLAVLGGVAAWLHDKDARRCQAIIGPGESVAAEPINSDVYLGG